MTRRAALFDMDKTLVRVNTARLFSRFRRARGQEGLRTQLQISIWLFQYSLGLIDADRVARQALAEYKDSLESDMIATCEEWFAEYVLPEVSPQARLCVKEHQERGDLVAIVTSSTIYGAGPLGRELGIEHVLTSELEVHEGRFTGDIVEPLCYGAGKIVRTKALLDQAGIPLSDASFYTDSVTDLPLLREVGEPVIVNPDARLLREAKKRNWPVLAW